nr:hypothetical protein [Mucilaginibacter sp. X5P1]
MALYIFNNQFLFSLLNESGKMHLTYLLENLTYLLLLNRQQL